MKSIITAFLCTCLLACAKHKPADNGYVAPYAGGPVKKWLALGDSYTIGQSVNIAESFPAQTANLLKQSGINMGLPDYIATTGWTTDDLAVAIQTKNPGMYDVVSLLIGVNDQYQRHDTTGYRQRFTNLLDKAIQLANGKKQNVFVLSIPDYSVTPFAAGSDTARIRKELDWFNAINKSVTDAYTIAYLDITPLTREALTDRSLLASDGLHPSGKEYKLWADRLAPVMARVLR